MHGLWNRAAIMGCMLLTGCALSPEYQAQQQAAIDAHDDAQCRQNGAVPRSKAYAACRTDLATRRQGAVLASDIGQRDFANTMLMNSLYGH